MAYVGNRLSCILFSPLASLLGLAGFIRAVSLLALCLTTLACFPEGPTASETFSGSEENDGEVFRSQLAEEEEVTEVKSVTANLQTGKTLGGAMALVSAIDDVAYRLVGCKSGYGPTLNTFSSSSLGLYRFDRDCQIHIDNVKLRNTIFRLPPDSSFNGQQGATNTFVSSIGEKAYIKVLSQLPPVLETSAYAVSFILAETMAGTNVSHSIYEVGISTAQTQLSESSGNSSTITVQRAAPATAALEVKLSYEGDATPGIDTNVLPSTLTLAAGETSKSFTITAINDTVFEGPEYIRVRIAPGTNYIPKNQVAEVDISDDDVAVLQAELALYNFGARTLNLPHSLRIKLSNVGRAPATQLQARSLTLPFSFPGGYPGDEGTCGAILPAGQSCFLVVGFSPTSSSLLNAALTIDYFNGALNSALSVTLRGSGAAAAYLTLSELGTFEFPVGRPAQSAKKHITIRNIGTATASALSGSFSSSLFTWAGGSFPGSGGSCTGSLAAGSQCTVVLSFMAPSAGFYEGLWQLSYSNGSQTLSQSLVLKASVNSLIARSATLTTGVNRSLALQLRAEGGSGPLSFEILSPPRFGTLSGTAPFLFYTPATNFTRMDSFTYRAIDSTGPSEAATMRIWVQPRALLLAGSFTLEAIEQSLRSRLISLGFSVTIQDDNLSTVGDAAGKELLLLSRSARRSRYQNKFFDAPVPAMVWDTTDMNEMRMLSGGSGNVTTRQIRINNSSHPIASGLSAGLQTVLTQNDSLAYGVTTSANAQSIASTSSNTSQSVIFGYEEGNYLPGNLIAPARRLATALPEDNDNLTSVGWQLFDQGVSWLMQGWSTLFYDSFQRDASLSLGSNWQENENGEAGAFQVAQDQLQMNSSAAIASVKVPFPMQTSGIITWSFYLDLKKGASAPSDYLQEFQLGRCDLMDKGAASSAGAAVHLVWGGTGSGLGGEEFLGARVGTSTTNLGQVNQRRARISVEVDVTNKRYTVQMPNGTLSSTINFSSAVSAINCLRLTSRNINNNGFTYRALEQIKIVSGR